MAKPPVGKEPTDQAAGQWSGEQLRPGHDESAEEGGSRGGESKRSPSDREVQEQSLDLRGGKCKKKKKKGQKGAMGPERKVPGWEAPEGGQSPGKAMGAGSEPSRAHTQPLGPDGAATSGSEPLSYALHMICMLLT